MKECIFIFIFLLFILNSGLYEYLYKKGGNMMMEMLFIYILVIVFIGFIIWRRVKRRYRFIKRNGFGILVFILFILIVFFFSLS